MVSRKSALHLYSRLTLLRCERFATERAPNATIARSRRRVTALQRSRLPTSFSACRSDTVAPVTGAFRLATLLAALLPAASGACRGRPPEAPLDAAVALAALQQRAVRDHAKLAHEWYDQAVAAARQLAKAVDSLVDRPSEATLRSAREAWLAARVPYVQTEVFRFYGGPIDRLETWINAWPIDESYIDAVAGAPDSGIVNALASHRDISPANLAELNERDGETSISTGFHAVEFLLWGQDLQPGQTGARSPTEFLPSARNGRRRAQYLKAATALLVQHLGEVAEAWRPGSADPFVTRFLSRPADEALALIWKGAGTLVAVELAGERLLVSYETKDQEDEHSCFSDNTHNDVIGNLLGVQNLLGTGLLDLVAAADAGCARELAGALDAALATARAIPAPFDQAIRGDDQSPGRRRVNDAIQAVRLLGTRLARAAAVLKLPPAPAGALP
jgi:putative iron-regulated protein